MHKKINSKTFVRVVQHNQKHQYRYAFVSSVIVSIVKQIEKKEFIPWIWNMENNNTAHERTTQFGALFNASVRDQT